MRGLPLLGACSWYSLMKAVSSPEALAQGAQEGGWSALGLADHNNMHALPYLVEEAAKCGIKAIAGASLEYGGISLRAWCLNRAGFARLCGIVSAILAIEVPRRRQGIREARSFQDDADAPGFVDELVMPEGWQSGIDLCKDYDLLADLLSAGWDGLALVSNQERVVRTLARRGRLYLGLQPRGDNSSLVDLAQNLRLPLLAEYRPHLVQASDADLLRLAHAIEERRTYRADEPVDAAAMLSENRMREALAEYPSALDAACDLAEEAEPAESFFASPPVFPAYRGLSDEESWLLLRSVCSQGAQRRYGPHALKNKALTARLGKELRIIKDKHFSAYFLVVRDIVQRCPRTCGRGSAASSLVSYLLELTHVDPLKQDLFFERFLNEGRIDPPDIDIDFPWDERASVLASVFADYRGRAAMVADHCCFSHRSALRETAIALGMNDTQLEETAKALRVGDFESLPDELKSFARRIYRMPHYIGMHPGGVVITPNPITHYTHVQPSPSGLPVLAWEKDGTETAGLVKIDILGNRSLAVLRDCIAQVNSRYTVDAEPSTAAVDHSLRSVTGAVSEQRNAAAPIDQEAATQHFLHSVTGAVSEQRNAAAPIDHEAATQHSLRSVTGAVSEQRNAAAPIDHEAATQHSLHSVTNIVSEQHEVADARSAYSAQIPDSRCAKLEWDFPDADMDWDTLALVNQGQTMGVFYIESPATRILLRKMGDIDYNKVVVASSIIRPAANKWINEYVRRLHGGKWKRLPAPVEKTLESTLGIMVYQEDVSRVAMSAAGFEVVQADALRKVLTKKRRAAKFQEFREAFLAGCAGHAVSCEDAHKMWDMMTSFDGYSFCKAHSASYALLSFRLAWMKAHFPAIFMAAVINNGGGFYGIQAYIGEARRLGITILPAHVNSSGLHYQVEGLPGQAVAGCAGGAAVASYSGGDKGIRVGLCQVSGVSSQCSATIVASRASLGAYVSLEDFVLRVKPRVAEMESLVRSGCLDGLGAHRNGPALSRPQAMFVLYWLRDLAQAGLLNTPQLPLGDAANSCVDIPPWIEDYSVSRRLADESHYLGVMVSTVPALMFARRAGAMIDRYHLPPLVEARQMDSKEGQMVTMFGIAIAGKEVRTKNGKMMAFYTFEDQSGVFETVLFPKIWESSLGILDRNQAVIVAGSVHSQFGVTTLHVNNIYGLNRSASSPALENTLKLPAHMGSMRQGVR